MTSQQAQMTEKFKVWNEVIKFLTDSKERLFNTWIPTQGTEHETQYLARTQQCAES
jgi:hypothetical protein